MLRYWLRSTTRTRGSWALKINWCCVLAVEKASGLLPPGGVVAFRLYSTLKTPCRALAATASLRQESTSWAFWFIRSSRFSRAVLTTSVHGGVVVGAEQVHVVDEHGRQGRPALADLGLPFSHRHGQQVDEGPMQRQEAGGLGLFQRLLRPSACSSSPRSCRASRSRAGSFRTGPGRRRSISSVPATLVGLAEHLVLGFKFSAALRSMLVELFLHRS